MKRRCIEENHPKLSISEQCSLLSLTRSAYYYRPRVYSEEDIKIMHAIDKIYTDEPVYGYRKIHFLLQPNYIIGRDRVLAYMRIMGIEAIYQKKRTTIPNAEHKKYPYLLRNITIERPNQVWAIDITYIRLNQGFCYLVAIIDWFSRYILSYKISNSLEIDFCIDVLQDALKKHGNPDICNSDQGSQFTSPEFTSIVENSGAQVSMDSKGRALDNVIIERWFRSLKYEDVYRQEYGIIPEAKNGIAQYVHKYNTKRPHQSLQYKTPAAVFFNYMD